MLQWLSFPGISSLPSTVYHPMCPKHSLPSSVMQLANIKIGTFIVLLPNRTIRLLSIDLYLIHFSSSQYRAWDSRPQYIHLSQQLNLSNRATPDGCLTHSLFINVDTFQSLSTELFKYKCKYSV